MEAMAMEISCVSTTIAGIPELIESGKEGVLVPPSDPDLLAAAIETLIDDPELRLRLARAGRRKVIESYNLRVNVERLAAIFERRLGIQARLAAPAQPAGSL
jgi:glycosyltransferase involved in cell wall biosynthesis